jgi:aryl-alcohol dehydrogenase-like predicted oxidoreductase
MVSKCNMLAELRGWTAFAGLQIEYSLLQRAPERDLLPMARHFGLAITPWGAIGGGALTGKYLKGEAGRVVAHSARRSDRANKIAAKVVKTAQKLGVTPAQVAINWTRQRHPDLNVIPLVGARTAAQLSDSLGCLSFRLPEKALHELDTASAIELGFPHDFLSSDNIRDLVYGGAYGQIVRPS